MNKKLCEVFLILGFISFTSLACCGGSMGGGGAHNMMMVGNSYWKESVTTTPFRHTGKVRTYYIAADEVIHDYAPLGFNGITGKPFTPDEADTTVRSENRIGSQYIKCLYREYTSSSFKTLLKREPKEQYLGILGPVIRGEVGDTIKIVYKNNCKFPNNIHTSGVFDDNNNHAVQTGETSTYVWEVAERCGPGLMDGSSIHWKYLSNVNPSSDFYAGLVGNIVITKRGWGRKDGFPRDIDQEVFFMFSVALENNSPYYDDNIAKFIPPTVNVTALKSNGGFTFSNSKDAINGFLYGNGPKAVMKKGERVRWHVMSVGGARDLHTPIWHGNTLTIDGLRMGVGSILPGETFIGDMVPDDVGTWLYHCHVGEHLDGGMVTTYEVVDNNKKDYY